VDLTELHQMWILLAQRKEK